MIGCIIKKMKDLIVSLKNLITYARVTLPLDDSKNFKIVQITYLDKTTNALIVLPYGLYAGIPNNIRLLKFNVLGDPGNLSVIPFDQENRYKNLAEYEVKVGNPNSGSYIYFKADGSIEIKSTSDMTIDVNGDLNIKATNFKIDAIKTDLGVSGAKIARVGDAVSGGVITTGGTNTSI